MNHLLIFIRNPVLGQVKTRIARTVGDVEALRIYTFLLEKTRLAALGVAALRHLWYSDFIPENDDWPADLFEKKVQHEGDLGQRMEKAFAAVFATAADAPQKAVIIGSDCPDLDSAILQCAFDALDTADFVVGPVPDGGYYLLGMKMPAPHLFQDIAWSTDTVRAHTLARIEAAQQSCALLPVLSDIDTEEDWVSWTANQR